MKPWILLSIFACCIAIGVVVLMPSSCRSVRGYWQWLARDDAYYAEVAEFCDKLILQYGVTPHEIRGPALQSLPTVLRKLSPDCVIVRTNVVVIGVGTGLISHKIVWSPDETDESLWKLKVYGGDSGHSRLVFSRRKPFVN